MDLQGGGISLQGGGGISLQGSSPNVQGSTIPVQKTVSTGTIQPATANVSSQPAKSTSTTSNNTTTNTTPAATSSGSGSSYQDKSNDIAIQQAGLAAIPQEEQTGVSAVKNALNQIMDEYNADEASATTEYNSNQEENNTDLQDNKQAALEDAVQGRSGLYGTLASLGALSGDGITLANNAVAKGANSDLTTAADTYAGNASALDTSYNAYTAQEKRDETGAQQAAQNDEEIAQNDALKDEDSYLKNLVADYSDEGNSAQAKSYAAQDAALMPQLAATNVPQLSIGYTGGAYTAPTLSSYVGSANNTTVKTTPGNTTSDNVFAIPGLIASNQKQTNGVT